MLVKRSLFSFINDIPLNFKFLMIYVLCVLVPMLTINIVFVNKISQDMKSREKENLNISINRAQTDITSIMEGCVDITHSVSSDKYLYEKMEKSYRNDSQYYEVYNDLLRERINRYLPIYNNVSFITLYTTNNTIDNGGNYSIINKHIKKSPWYKYISKSNNAVMLYSYMGKAYDGSKNRTQYLSIMRHLNEFASSGDKYEQILKIDIDMRKMYDIFDRERDYLNLMLVDPKGNIICSTDHQYEKYLSKGYINFSKVYHNFKDKIDFNRSLGRAEYLDGWRIIGIANHGKILHESEQSNSFNFIIIFGVTFISSVLIYIIVMSYNYRLKKLLKHMKGVENQKFELIQMPEGKDEIGNLILRFNMMTSRINTLINDVYKLQLKKKNLEIQRVQAELRFLQSQIDPHFLFNTLNAVMAVCVRNNYTDLTEVIKYLSKIFRRLVSWKDDLVTVREEISFTEMYLKIEKFRFLEKFNYEIEVDEDILDFRIPKMSIQTIVENACKHGIQNSTDIGIVKIRVTQKCDFLFVDVEDNGSGIEEEKLKEILESLLEEEELYESIGIRNVYKRLHLYYGGKVEFDIKSDTDKGTIVHFGIDMKVLNEDKSVKQESVYKQL
ncbi:sensor histidine kinase [Clostridium oryzae]|uniref:Sensor histidine kinase YehU n=1 Tax=Clostridium oryzae TaxID=1450648 RepID=A0A1V4ING0_9CLOT|nr:histidine kinase [Clostridium oryzae]OPJ61389.1 sensor histidine kinase YehU [Clostridium oryzae]